MMIYPFASTRLSLYKSPDGLTQTLALSTTTSLVLVLYATLPISLYSQTAKLSEVTINLPQDSTGSASISGYQELFRMNMNMGMCLYF